MAIKSDSQETLKRGGQVEDSTIVGFSAAEAGSRTRQLLKDGNPWSVLTGNSHM
jgi:hypothetical protein